MASIRRRRRLGLGSEPLESRTLLSLSTPAALAAANDPAASLVVRFADGTPEPARRAALGTLGEVVETFDSGTSLVALRPGVDADQALRSLRADPALQFAEPNGTLRVAVTPSDPLFSQQWGLGTAGINAPAAWDATTGGASVLVAVVDTGVDYNHPDLAGRLWVNSAEIPGNGIDDEGDGYVDDVRGWNFVAGTNDPLDDNGHGTHVSGTIGAATNNARGVAGVDWNARVLPLKFLDATGSGTTAAAIRAIEFAARHGARIINASWGSSYDDPALAEAIRYAGTLGSLFVAAAGNTGSNNDATPFYPAAYRLPNLIAVAATTSAGTLAGFSNYGPTSVDVAAPGEGILSTVPGGGYAGLSGTSVAAPHVSGVAALVAARFPQLTAQQLADRIKATTRPLAALAGKVASGGIVDASLAVGPAPDIQVLDGAADLPDGSGSVVFGTTTVGTPLARTFTVRNAGTAALTLGTSIAVPAGFSVTAGFGATQLAPGASTQFALRFDAAAAGTAAGRVSFTTDDADENPFDFAVAATAVTPAQAAAPRILDNGDAGYALAGGGWSYQANLGYKGIIHYAAAGAGASQASWTFTGLIPGRYRVSATWAADVNRATNAPYTVIDGATTLGTVAVNQKLRPDDLSDAGTSWEDLGGPYAVTGGTVVVRLTNQANNYVIADAVRIERVGDLIASPAPEVQVLDGAADLPDGTGSVVFGSTAVGTPVTRTFTVRNTGTAALTLGALAAPAGFSVASSFGTTQLTAGGSTQFALRFDAAAVGTASGRVSFATNDADENPFDFAVAATASAPEVQVLDGATDLPDGTGSVSFGTTPVGTPLTRTFTVRNTGTAALTLGTLAAPAGFSVTAGFGATQLAPGGSTQFVLRFDAMAAGTAAGRLSFATNDADENPFDFAVTATASAPAPAPAVRILDNGDAGYALAGGGWSYQANLGYKGIIHYAAAGAGASQASWTFTGLIPGRYRVSATWAADVNRATNAPYTVIDGATTLGTVAVNQKLRPDDLSDAGAAWEDLGGAYAVTGSTLVVRLTNQANNYVIADAVRIERLGDLTTTVSVGTSQDLNVALAAAKPGTRILLQPGTYSGGIYVSLRGAPSNPIVVAAADPSQRPVIRGGGDGFHIVDAEYVELDGLILDGAVNNGLNIDDGGTYDTPAHHVTLRNLTVRNVVATGGSNGIKLSGVDQFTLLDSVIDGWGGGASGIDMVGCHDGLIAGTTFRNGGRGGANGVQAKGGSRRLVVRDSRFEQAGARAIQIGGSTGSDYYRPQPPPPYEAKDITVEGNTLIGSGIAFVNVDGSTARFNTIYRPTGWAIRILQEVTAPGFVPCRNGVVTDNIFVFRADEAAGTINVGPDTAPETFQFARNAWYCLDVPAFSRPTLPAPEVDGVYGVDPLFVTAEAGDLHLQANSPFRNKGAYAPRP